MKKYFLVFVLVFASTLAIAQSLNVKLHQAIIAKDTVKVEKLLNEGADANYKPQMGAAQMVLLTVAVNNGDLKSVKLLVDHKGKIDARDWFNSTPLMYAAASGKIDIVNFLIQNGADVKANDGKGNTVLSAAIEGKNPDMIKLIEEKLKE